MYKKQYFTNSLFQLIPQDVVKDMLHYINSENPNIKIASRISYPTRIVKTLYKDNCIDLIFDEGWSMRFEKKYDLMPYFEGHLISAPPETLTIIFG